MGIINTTGCATKEHIQWDHYKILDPDHGSQAAQIMAKFRALMYFKFGPFLGHFWNFSDFQSSSVFLILHPGSFLLKSGHRGPFQDFGFHEDYILN